MSRATKVIPHLRRDSPLGCHHMARVSEHQSNGSWGSIGQSHTQEKGLHVMVSYVCGIILGCKLAQSKLKKNLDISFDNYRLLY